MKFRQTLTAAVVVTAATAFAATASAETELVVVSPRP